MSTTNVSSIKKNDANNIVPAILGGPQTRKTKIFYGRQWINEDDVKAVAETLTSDYITCGPKVDEFELKLAAFCGAKYAVAVTNDTSALHIACVAAGIGPGDEIITTPLTFMASANCALYCGAKPVFADVNPKTYQIDPDDIERKMTERTIDSDTIRTFTRSFKATVSEK